jgi:hypothetical protein
MRARDNVVSRVNNESIERICLDDTVSVWKSRAVKSENQEARDRNKKYSHQNESFHRSAHLLALKLNFPKFRIHGRWRQEPRRIHLPSKRQKTRNPNH